VHLFELKFFNHQTVKKTTKDDEEFFFTALFNNVFKTFFCVQGVNENSLVELLLFLSA
jgi:hypothetical protein